MFLKLFNPRRGNHQSPACIIAVALRPKATPSVSRLRRETAHRRRSRGREGAFCRTAGVVREDKIHRPQKMFRLHEFCGTRLPRGGRVGRVLPAADAVAAKAEGVVHPSAAIFPRCASPSAKRTTLCIVSAHCVEHYPSGAPERAPRAERGFLWAAGH